MEDYLLKIDDESCPRYAQVGKLAKENEQYQAVYEYFVSNYKLRLEKLVNQSISNGQVMNDICGYIQWAQFAKLELKFEPT